MPNSNILDKALVKARYRFVNKLIPEHSRIVDLGSGFGIGYSELRVDRIWLISIDIDSICLKYIKESLDKSNIDLICSSICLLPIRDKSIHISLAMDVIEHIKCINEFLQEIKRICKGYAIISTPNAKFVRRNPSHIKEYTLRELIKLFKKWKFKIISIYGQVVVNKLFKISQLLRTIFHRSATIIDFDDFSWNEDLLIKIHFPKPYRYSVLNDFAHLIFILKV